MKRKISYFFILFVIISNSHSLGFISSFPIWEDNNFIQVNSSDNNFLNLESESAILIEQTTGQILFEKNPHEKLRPASVTKIMSLLLIMEAIENGQVGDVIVLAGKGHEDYQEIKGVKYDMDERVLIREVLEESTKENLIRP